MTAVIEMHQLTKWYGRHRGIEDIDLAIEPGQVFGFLGPNGAGKSTAMRVLLDFHRPTSGSAALLGLDAHTQSLAIRRRTSYLSGDVALYERLTAREQLTWLGDLRGGIAATLIEELAERLTLDLTRKIGDLSKGNRQKVGLVQAFMAEPELLILDEPTSGLDPLVQHTFQELVREIADDGRTVFLSSHIIDEVDRTCDRVAIIREGRLEAVETIESLRARAMRSVRITFDQVVDPTEFVGLEGVHEVGGSGRVLNIKMTGDIDSIVKHAARHHVVELVSERADLEEIFLAFYAGESPDQADEPPAADGSSGADEGTQR
jgi:ABC-2 type transport system ATP-binding protein